MIALLSVLAIVWFTLGSTAPAEAVPDQPEAATQPDTPDHFVPSSYSHDVCVWGQNGAVGVSWSEHLRTLWAWHTVHYGSTHVTQCAFKDGYVDCLQMAWSDSVWRHYVPPSTTSPFCW